MATLGGKISGKLPTTGQYMSDINLSNPPDYGFIVVTNDLDLDTGNFVSNISFAPTLTDNGTYTVKRYDVGDNIVETRQYYSGATAVLPTRNDSSIATQYGTLTKWSIEADSAAKPITTLSFSTKLGMVALSFGDNYFDAYTTLSSAFSANKSLLKVVLPSALNTITNFSSAFQNCFQLETIVMPTSMSACTTFATAFSSCKRLTSLTFPTTTGTVTSLASMLSGCEALESFALPATMDSVTTMASMCAFCYNLTTLTLPTSFNAVTTLASAFQFCYKLTSLTLPTSLNNLTTMANMCQGNYSLTTVTLPTSMTSLATYADAFNECNALTTITECTTYAAGQVNATTHGVNLFSMTTYDQPFKASKLDIKGTSDTIKGALTSIDIDWANSTFGGGAPQVDLRYNNLDKTEIDRIFTALPTTAKTINVAGNPGAATCDTSIATTKTWTVTTS